MTNVLSVNTSDQGGGAERVAWALFQGIRRRGLNSSLVVGDKRTSDPAVHAFHDSPHINYRKYSRPISRLTQRYQKWNARRSGREDFHFPYTKYLTTLTGVRPDLVHCHNLHGGYFDLRFLSQLSQQVPVLLTLHDSWTFTGHCACPAGCERWHSGCGRCPQLDQPPAVSRDGTAANWRAKARIYRGCRLYVAAPSPWMMRRAQSSILAPAIQQGRVIPNGIDCGVFRRGDRMSARRELGISEDTTLLLFVANGARSNPYKDYATLRWAMEVLARRLPETDIQLLTIGEQGAPETIGRATLRHLPYVRSRTQLARYYQAADVYVHAAHEENCPLTILEAMACGLPAVATSVGGTADIVHHDDNGLLVERGDYRGMAAAVVRLVENRALRARLGRRAADFVQGRYTVERMVDAYVDWYQQILTAPAMQPSGRIAA